MEYGLDLVVHLRLRYLWTTALREQEFSAMTSGPGILQSLQACAYIYHTVGLAATNYIRLLGVPCSQYIDDCHVGQLALHRDIKKSCGWPNFALAEATAFIVCSVLVSLGDFICLSNSVTLPQTRIRFLGLLSDSVLQAFIIPEDKNAISLLPFVSLFSKTTQDTQCITSM